MLKILFVFIWMCYFPLILFGTPPHQKALDYGSWPGNNILFFIQQLDQQGPGHITFHLPDGKVYRQRAESAAPLENLSDLLDLFSPAPGDDWLNVAPSGDWFVFSAERFDARCNGWSCLAVSNSAVTEVEVVIAGGDVIHPEGFSAISPDGNMIIFPYNGGPHAMDLWRVEKVSGEWQEPELLTGDSPFQWHQEPAISSDGTKMLFSAGLVPFAQEGTRICESNLDGTNFQVVFRPEDGPGGTATHALKSPDYAPDGSIIFEADWSGEQIWRLNRQTNSVQVVNSIFGNDNSPCVLPDGRIVSLWLEPNGLHEIKIMHADGSMDFMLLSGIDVDDIGMGCGH